MAKNEFLEQIEINIKSDAFGSERKDYLMWYNKEGDSLHFKTTDIDVIRERIDGFLTLYLSLEDNKPIGFQLKDIKALSRALDAELIVGATCIIKEKELIGFILKALINTPQTISRFAGYQTAVETITKEIGCVESTAA